MGNKKDSKPSEGKQPDRQAVEAWASELATPAWAFAAARMKHSWPEGRQLSRADYEKAVKAATSEVIH
jgi:hypothetical protein